MLATIMLENQEFKHLLSPEEALARGSSFSNLYIPYKYEAKTILKGNNEKQGIIAMLDMYSFMSFDLSEYLDTHSNCDKAKEALSLVNDELAKIKKYYDEKYGDLTFNSVNHHNYSNLPWPWEDLF